MVYRRIQVVHTACKAALYGNIVQMPTLGVIKNDYKPNKRVVYPTLGVRFTSRESTRVLYPTLRVVVSYSGSTIQ
jgi:hypothetical protein